MKRLGLAMGGMLAVAAVAASTGAVPDARAVVPAAGSLGTAIEVPGLGALNTGGDAQVTSVSCPSAGNCTAGGYYAGHGSGAFVAAEVNGRWATAIQVPGLSALSVGYAQVLSVSCASAGNCAAGGYYYDRSSYGNQQGFVAVERNGRWGGAISLRGLPHLNEAGFAEVVSVSCGAAGSCAAGGWYTARHQLQQGFVAVERNGVWGRAIEVPGLGALNTIGYAAVTSVSCGAAGSCAAGGYYNDGQGVFVADERNYAWGKTIEVPGLAALIEGANGGVDSVSCASAGSCTAGGTYGRAFVAAERHGRWAKATTVPGLVNKRGLSQVTSVSCASPGNCAAGGEIGDSLAFVVTERNGRWGTAVQVPGLQALGSGPVSSVSCAAAGRCMAAGWWFRAGRVQLVHAFVATWDNGRWGKAIRVPGLAALDKGTSQPFALVTFFPVVSCAPAGPCTVGGAYTDASNHAQGYVTQTT